MSSIGEASVCTSLTLGSRICIGVGSSFWPYYARLHEPWAVPGPDWLCGVSGREYAAAALGCEPGLVNIRRWNKMKRGGHFAALQERRAFSEDVLGFLRDLRDAPPRLGQSSITRPSR